MGKKVKLDWSEIWNQNKGGLSSALLDWLQKTAVKNILKKLVISGGMRGWLVSFVVEEVVEEIDEHIVEPLFRRIGYTIEVGSGTKTYRKVIDATNIDDWVDASNDV